MNANANVKLELGDFDEAKQHVLLQMLLDDYNLRKELEAMPAHGWVLRINEYWFVGKQGNVAAPLRAARVWHAPDHSLKARNKAGDEAHWVPLEQARAEALVRRPAVMMALDLIRDRKQAEGAAEQPAESL